MFKVTNNLYAVEFKYGIGFLKYHCPTTCINLISYYQAALGN